MQPPPPLLLLLGWLDLDHYKKSHSRRHHHHRFASHLTLTLFGEQNKTKSRQQKNSPITGA